MPWVAVAFTIGGLVSMGMPGLSGFVAEFPIFMGVWKVQPLVAIIAAISIVITASYIIRVIGRVFFGSLPAHFEHGDHAVGDVTVLDKVALGLICIIMIVIGVYPSVMVPLVQSGVNHILALVGGA